AAFRKKYNYIPSYYAAQQFDAIFQIDDAVKAVKGNLADKEGMIARIEKADFPSVRGKFAYNTNHFPIENFYLLKIAKDSDGQYVRKIQAVTFANHKDAYASECQMKPYK
ncbi:MAG: ABC transporter substrate-binding protein, partial [Alphaproteobacteria bacterium]|nr:ABC transporter substrate-binding protein [Alphaproteobacteria bacterium]